MSKCFLFILAMLISLSSAVAQSTFSPPDNILVKFHSEFPNAQNVKWYRGNYLLDTVHYQFKVLYEMKEETMNEGTENSIFETLFTDKDSSYTFEQEKHQEGFVPSIILSTFNSLHPNAVGIYWSYNTNESDDHELELPKNFFNGRKFYRVYFIEGFNVDYIRYDSLGDVIHIEKYVNMNSFNIPKKIKQYLNKNFSEYKIEDGSVKKYSSNDSIWKYDIHISNRIERELTFDSLCNFISSYPYPLPPAIKLKFENRYPTAQNIDWDSSRVARDKYKIYFKNGLYQKFADCDANGNNWVDGTPFHHSKFYIPDSIAAKIAKCFPNFKIYECELDNWWRHERSDNDIDTDKWNYGFQFSGWTEEPGDFSALFDYKGNFIDSHLSISSDSLPLKVKEYIHKKYKKYTVGNDLPCIVINAELEKLYQVNIINASGDDGYTLYFDKAGNFTKKE
jgi:hypothetical protein